MWMTASSMPPARSTPPSARSASGARPGYTTSQSIRSAGWSRIGASTASWSATAALMWSLCPWVSAIAVTRRPATASTIGVASCAASTTSTSRSSPMSQMLLVTSHSPPSRAKIPSVVTSSIIRAPRRCAGPRRAASWRTPPRRRRGRSSPTRSAGGRGGPGGAGRSAEGSRGSAGSRRTRRA